MRKLSIITGAAVMLAACAALAWKETTWTATSLPHPVAASNAVAVAQSSRNFSGELESIHVYVPDGVTSTVQVTISAPYGGPTYIVATNEELTGYALFVPRFAALNDEATAGNYVPTNAAAGSRVIMAGESITATISDTSTSNAPVLFRAVYQQKD